MLSHTSNDSINIPGPPNKVVHCEWHSHHLSHYVMKSPPCDQRPRHTALFSRGCILNHNLRLWNIPNTSVKSSNTLILVLLQHNMSTSLIHAPVKLLSIVIHASSHLGLIILSSFLLTHTILHPPLFYPVSVDDCLLLFHALSALDESLLHSLPCFVGMG